MILLQAHPSLVTHPIPGKHGRTRAPSSINETTVDDDHRYVLNFKRAHYKTEWVELPDVTSVRKKLGAPPNRTHLDGTPFYTLPVIHDPTTGEIIGDSFDIALYLDKLDTGAPTLFPPSTVGLQAAFNVQAEAIFTQSVLLWCHNLPFNPETADATKAAFVERVGKESWEDLTVHLKEKAETLETFKAGLEQLAKFYGRSEGLFLERDTPIYADLIVGGWLASLKVTLKEWDEVQAWNDGLWGKIHQGLEKYAEVR